MEHVFTNPFDQMEYEKDPVEFNKKLNGQPKFIGQGYSYGCGSDCYGGYIVEHKKLPNGKEIWGLQSAKTHMTTCWEDGHETCDGPIAWTASVWIIARGKIHRYGKTIDLPQWWFCDKNGKRMTGRGAKCTYHFSGAHAYRDPSF